MNIEFAMIDVENLPYRKCVGIMLLNDHNQVWVGRRIPKWSADKGALIWQMPQGGIDAGETPEQAAWRELKEETSVSSARLIDTIDDWLYYDLPKEVVGTALKGKYRGQKQKWFAMALTGPESEINIAADDGLEQEFDQWKWCDMDQLVDLIVPFKRDVYAQVIKNFSHLSR